MSINRGPNIVTDGLVFGYDADDRSSRFYPGEPTVNLAGDGHLYGMSGVVLTYLGIDNGWKKYSLSGTFSNGTYPYCIYCTSVSFIGGVSYSTKCTVKTNVAHKFNYFMIDRISYVNVAKNIEGTAYRVINDDGSITIGTSNFQYSTNTTQVGYFYTNPINNTTFNSSTDFVWMKELQIEQKTHFTQYTLTSRGVTDGLIDLKKSTSIDLTNVSFDSTAHPVFDGAGDFISIPISASILNSGSWTFEMITKITQVNKGNDNQWIWFGSSVAYQGLHIVERYTKPYFGFYADDMSCNTTLLNNTWYHIVWIYNHSTATKTVYVNGVFDKSAAQHTFDGTGSSMNICNNFYGSTPILKLYNRVLSSEEIQQNFNSYKLRYGI